MNVSGTLCKIYPYVWYADVYDADVHDADVLDADVHDACINIPRLHARRYVRPTVYVKPAAAR